jgi:hypothetical protein
VSEPLSTDQLEIELPEGSLDAPEVEPAQAEGVVDPGTGAVSSRELEDLRSEKERVVAELETEKKRRADTQADWHAQQRQIGYMEHQVQAVQGELERRTMLAEQAAQREVPSVKDPDELVAEPQNIVDFVYQVANHLYETIAAESQPFYSTVAGIDKIMHPLTARMQTSALDQAENMLRGEDSNYNQGDLAKVWGQLDQVFKQSPHGAAFRLDPERIVQAYYLARRSARKKPVPQAGINAPMSVAPTANADKASGAQTVTVPRDYVTAMKRLGMKDPDRIRRSYKRYLADKGRTQ